MAFWAILDIVILYLDFYFHVKWSKMGVYREDVMYGNTDCVKKSVKITRSFLYFRLKNISVQPEARAVEQYGAVT